VQRSLDFFIGALFYQVGGSVAELEAINSNSFHGVAMQRFLPGHEKEDKEMLDAKVHAFFHHMSPHHRRRAGNEESYGFQEPSRRDAVDLGEPEEKEGLSTEYTTWRWYVSWHALKTYHIHALGYQACTIQLFGVTLYGVTSIVIFFLSSLSPWQTNAAYWIPQIVAAACFLIASIMFTLETQEKWWKLEPTQLGWWIGVWSTIGSIGFE